MAKRRTRLVTIAELPAGRRDRDEDVLPALVTAGALMWPSPTASCRRSNAASY
jgi:hypothetical protein